MTTSHVCAILVCLVTTGLRAAAAEPFLDKIDLFEAGKDGYKLYRIPGIVVTAKGTVLAYCEARKSESGDWGPIDILLRRSTDGGKTWGPRRVIADVRGPKAKNPAALAQRLANPEDVTYNNPVAIAGRDGVVHFLFCLEYMRCFYLKSEDDGVNFSRPVEITAAFEKLHSAYPWKVLATGPGHGIQLKNGRLLAPFGFFKHSQMSTLMNTMKKPGKNGLLHEDAVKKRA